MSFRPAPALPSPCPPPPTPGDLAPLEGRNQPGRALFLPSAESSVQTAGSPPAGRGRDPRGRPSGHLSSNFEQHVEVPERLLHLPPCKC